MTAHRVLLALVTAAATLLVTSPAEAYYDDVHYVVTYYVARQAGYTPEQAYRIASLCVSVDYDPDTEPVQGPSQLALATTPFTGFAANPRWKFHAMRDEDVFHDCIGDSSKDAARAEDMIMLQQGKLWDRALQIGNPGAFLHFFQDEVPHHAYGTWWGHWPMLPGSVQTYHDKGMVIGGVTDWVAYRPNDVTTVCQTTHAWLTQFMDKGSPHQVGRAYNPAEYPGVIASLARANPAPTDIDSEDKRASYINFFAQTKVGLSDDAAKPFDPFGLGAVAAKVGVTISDSDFSKLKNGPDLEGACDVVDAALQAAGTGDRIPRKHFLYSLDEDGRLDDQSMADKFTLVGSLQTSTEGGEDVTASLLMAVRDAGGQTSEQPLRNEPPITLKPGAAQTWDQLPIGEVILELAHQDGTKSRHPFTLDKRVNVFPAIKVGEAAPAVERNPGIGGHWLWQRKRADGSYDLVPCYLTPQDDGTFRGVMFPLITMDNLVQTPGNSPDRVSFTPNPGLPNAFFVERKYAEGGGKAHGAMVLSGNTMGGTWGNDATGESDFWSWIRPTPEQLAKLQAHFGR